MQQKKILQLCQLFIPSILDYRSPVYDFAPPSNIKFLYTIQSTALRIAICTFRTSLFLSLHAQTGHYLRMNLTTKLLTTISLHPDFSIKDFLFAITPWTWKLPSSIFQVSLFSPYYSFISSVFPSSIRSFSVILLITSLKLGILCTQYSKCYNMLGISWFSFYFIFFKVFNVLIMSQFLGKILFSSVGNSKTTLKFQDIFCDLSTFETFVYS